MCSKHIILVCVGVFSILVSVCHAQLPEVPSEAIEALGLTLGTPKRKGFVFIEGRYISPPYTVSRKGNGIFINRIQVEQPIAWTAEALTPSAIPPSKAVVNTPDKAEEVNPSPLPPPLDTAAPVAVIDSGAVATPPTTEGQVGKSLDALFDGPSTNNIVIDAPNPAGLEKKALPVGLTQQQKDELRKKLDMIRARFELGLAQGEIYFFNMKHGRVNGTYGTAKALFAVLPEALRYSQSPQDLMARLGQGGVNFLDLATCVDLYKNKLNFMVLSDRRRLIELDEATKRP
jgi:hypothetical protein